MKQPEALTQERLKEFLHYDQETGVFRWRFARSMHQKPWDEAGGKDNHGYTKIMLMRKMHKAHRLAWLYVTGNFPDGQVDHINGIRSDNTIKNLRIVTNKQNAENMAIRTSNTSGFRGVSFHKRSGMYEAFITHNQKKKFLGMFKDANEAAKITKEARDKTFTHSDREAI